MIYETLLEKLKALQNHPNPEVAHEEADYLLLDYINDPEITEAFNDITRWYE